MRLNALTIGHYWMDFNKKHTITDYGCSGKLITKLFIFKSSKGHLLFLDSVISIVTPIPVLKETAAVRHR